MSHYEPQAARLLSHPDGLHAASAALIPFTGRTDFIGHGAPAPAARPGRVLRTHTTPSVNERGTAECGCDDRGHRLDD